MPEFDVGDTLSRQVGPLPVGGWLLAIAGGLGVAYFLNRDAPSPDPDPGTIDPGSDAGLGFTSRGGVGTDLLGPSLPTQPPASDDGDDDGEPTTNTGWGLLAIRTGMDLGYGPLATNAAVSRYLTGQELTREQAKLLDAILREIGPPPNPVPTPRIGNPPRDDGSGGQTPTSPPPQPTTPPPTPPPPAPAPKPTGSSSTPTPSASGRIYTIVRGDTLWGIARRFYGSGSKWPTIWKANSSVGSDGIGLRSGNPDLIFPGERIRIP